MRLRDVHRGEDGTAILEFLGLAVLLMVPLAYVLLTVFEVQRAAYAVSSATREAGRVFVTADSTAQGEVRAFAAAGIVLRDSGLALQPGGLVLACSADPCLTPGATVTVELNHEVALPLAPPVFGGAAPAAVPVSGTHVAVVDRFRPVRP